ncbi:MAG: mannose-1-phosphate guanylyltransferase/mannose-6-phosphate isomerase [Gammaproteobacteria bacterium]|nr:mannose-1-phosphate guanylyltransferase/mannose-6-phosphate isomerase [Gammaproteobacteria bacterium]
MKLIPVVLCGGSGTRLWPLSRKSYPKQFLSLVSNQSLFQDTLKRAAAVTSQKPLVITNNEYRFLVAEQVAQCETQASSIMLEPVSRNTAPAIAAAAIEAIQQNKGEAPLLLVLPADHVIHDTKAFADSVSEAVEAAEKGKLVTFGIVPDKPETGYGYIQARDQIESHGARQVEKFVEKPDLEKAVEYLNAGNYFWNSGMFLFRADRYLEELEKFQPDIKTACEQAVEKGVKDLDFFRLDEEAFAGSPDDSIDYAVMETSGDVAVVPMNAGWSDIGSWSALSEVRKTDNYGNASSGDVLMVNSRNCLVHSEKRLVTTLGVDNLVIVETSDAILVAHKNQAQNVKDVVNRLKEDERDVATSHRETYRPWGKYDSVDNGERFQVKRITVNPGETLSLQKHFHRAEHWIVVSGIAEVTRDNDVFNVAENESVYIPLGAVHRLSNPGKIALELIEVQSGSYLGEDDIVRLDDNYGRESSVISLISKTA